MPDFEISATPIQAWALELRGGDRVQFNGRLMADCVSEALQCADLNGCLEPGAVGLTDGCAETLARHDESTGCADLGFGIRVRQVLTSPSLPSTPSMPTGPGVPQPSTPAGGLQSGQAGADWLPGT